MTQPERHQQDPFAERAAPPSPRQVAGVFGIVIACVAVIGVVAYFIATGTS